MLAGLSVALIGSRASAAPMSYVVDPTESSLTVAIFIGGPPAAGGIAATEAQIGTSDTSALSGTMSIDTSGGNISFLGGTITPALQPFALLPATDGGSPSGPGTPVAGLYQFGLQLNPLIGLGTGYASIYNVASSVTDLTSPTSLSGGLFDATQQNVNILSGTLAYWLNTTIAGLVYGNEVAAPPTLSARNGIDSHGSTGYIGSGSVTTVGPLTTVTLPVFADAYVAIGSGVGIDIIFDGQIVAVAGGVSIPEPGSITLMGIALVGGGLGWAVRRRHRQK
jgi:hypothetical protein